MARLLLTDDEWDLISSEFPKPNPMGRPRRDPRQIMDAVLWTASFLKSNDIVSAPGLNC